MITESDAMLSISTPSEEAATDTLSAIRELAFRGSAKKLDIELAWYDCNENAKPFNLVNIHGNT